MRDRDYLRHHSEPMPEQEAPSLLTLLIVTNVGVYLLLLLFAMPTPAGTSPAGFISHGELSEGRWWTVFTHLFVHNDWFHLASNMVCLWLVGRSVIDQLGSRHFGYLYFIGGWVGTALALFGGPRAMEIQLIGASGAVFSIIAAFATLNPTYSVTEPFRRWLTFRLSVKNVVIAVVFAELVLEVLGRIPALSRISGPNVSHLCHVGGAVFGFLYSRSVRPHTYPFRRVRPSPAQKRRMIEFDDDFEDIPFVTANKPLRSRNEREQEESIFPVPAPEPVSDREFILNNVDPILEKLHDKGIGSLTPEEQKILREAANRLKK